MTFSQLKEHFVTGFKDKMPDGVTVPNYEIEYYDPNFKEKMNVSNDEDVSNAMENKIVTFCFNRTLIQNERQRVKFENAPVANVSHLANTAETAICLSSDDEDDAVKNETPDPTTNTVTPTTDAAIPPIGGIAGASTLQNSTIPALPKLEAEPPMFLNGFALTDANSNAVQIPPPIGCTKTRKNATTKGPRKNVTKKKKSRMRIPKVKGAGGTMCNVTKVKKKKGFNDILRVLLSQSDIQNDFSICLFGEAGNELTTSCWKPNGHCLAGNACEFCPRMPKANETVVPKPKSHWWFADTDDAKKKFKEFRERKDTAEPFEYFLPYGKSNSSLSKLLMRIKSRKRKSWYARIYDAAVKHEEDETPLWMQWNRTRRESHGKRMSSKTVITQTARRNMDPYEIF